MGSAVIMTKDFFCYWESPYCCHPVTFVSAVSVTEDSFYYGKLPHSFYPITLVLEVSMTKDLFCYGGLPYRYQLVTFVSAVSVTEDSFYYGQDNNSWIRNQLLIIRKQYVLYEKCHRKENPGNRWICFTARDIEEEYSGWGIMPRIALEEERGRRPRGRPRGRWEDQVWKDMREGDYRKCRWRKRRPGMTDKSGGGCVRRPVITETSDDDDESVISYKLYAMVGEQ
ncbi:hypothetical protein J6590_020789 [Homalodisca vitripennis]|nr:hypothetical protein J6590_020789 [Homalodisca vitripennis]